MPAPTYTFATKTPPTSGSSNFGNLPVDGSHNTMTGYMGSGIQTQDSTASPVTSPATVTTGTTLTVPINASAIVLYTSAALRVSELSTTTGYFVVPAANSIEIDVARMGSIYLKQDSGSCTVQFYFIVI